MKQLSLLFTSLAALQSVACGGAEEPAQAVNAPGPSDSSQAPVGPGNTTSPSTTGPDSTGNPPVGQPETPTTEIPDNKPPQLAKCESSELGAPVLRALTKFEFQNSVDDIFPGIKGKWTNSLPSNLLSQAGFDNDASSALGEQTTEQLLSTAESVGDAVSASLSSLLPCSSQGDRACAAQFVDTYGKRLFRRPLADAEKEQHLALFDTALAQTDFTRAMKWLTAALVQSPKAIYRSELGTPNGGNRSLTQHEVASLLAYAFTGTTPSAELLAKADAGQLTDPVSEAKALVQTDAGKQTLHRFFEAYTWYPRAASKNKPAAQHGGITYDQVSPEMVQETRAFLDNLLFSQGANLQELLTDSSTYPSQRLATFYGFSSPSGDYASVERPAGQGVGLMAQGAFLAAHANADASSPTQRGLFAYTNLMCRAKPPLPDDVPQLTEVTAGERTTRQRYEELHAQGNCAGCHKLFDPIGFAFEHYDEAGRYRPDEDGLPIDPSGYIVSVDGQQMNFASQEELAQSLAELPEVHECFAAYLATYAFGTTESCLATSAVPQMQAGTLSVVDAFASLAGEPHFTQRNAE